MHNIHGSTGMDQDNPLVQDSTTYPNDHWAGMNPYSQMAMPNFGGEYYLPSSSHGLPSESISPSHMGPPPVPQQLQQQQHHHQPQHHHQAQHTYASHLPQPLVIPTQTTAPQVSWPSLRTNPSQNYAAPPVPIPPQSAPPLKQQPKLPSITTSTPRKTLTNEDRRRMCQYAMDHPNTKQTEIGLKFGVERSTVSKVLRKRDQYLNLEDRSSSPVKKPKTKNAGELERTLANWARNQQKKGIVVSDEELETQARAFFTGTGSSENPLKIITRSWLEKFKQKNGMGPGKLIRRASETAVPDSVQFSGDSPILSPSETPGGNSPVSPTGQQSPQVLSATPSNEANEPASAYSDIQPSPYKNPQSATSLPSAVTEPASSTFSGTFSPGSQIHFSPDPNNGMFDQRRLPIEALNFQRPRSQTFPTLDLEFSQQQSGGESTPRHDAATAPSSALDSPAHEIAAPMYTLDSTISPTLHHSRSSSSLGGRSTNTPILPSAVASSPGSPTQEDARRAADILWSFVQHMPSGTVNSDEIQALLRLTEKLRLAQPQQLQSFKISAGLGGLSRIPEADAAEMRDDGMMS